MALLKWSELEDGRQRGGFVLGYEQRISTASNADELWSLLFEATHVRGMPDDAWNNCLHKKFWNRLNVITELAA